MFGRIDRWEDGRIENQKGRRIEGELINGELINEE